MNIIPLKGVDEILFGVFNSDIKILLGQPDVIENLGANDGVSSEIYIYKSLGLSLYFDGDANFRLWGIGITTNLASLLGVNPIGLTEAELLKAFPNIKLDVCDDSFKEYILPKEEIEFVLKNNIVKRIMVNPNLDEYCKEYAQ